MVQISEEEKNEKALAIYLKAKVVQLTNKKFYGRLVIDFRAGNVYQLKTEQVETMSEIKANIKRTASGG